MPYSRRSLLASGLAPYFASAQPRRKYKTATVGTGWWGMNITREAMRSGECQLAAVCDVDGSQIRPAAAEIEKLSGDKPRQYRDYREMLAKEKPEICIVATPDHWHPLVMIEAVHHGAHVYVEKPISHTILEGRAMVNAARDAARVVQVGTHRRVSPHNISGMEFLRAGKAGKMGMVRAFVHNASGPGAKTPDSDPPPDLDWDFWLGPAPKRGYNKSIHPRGFRQHLDYANGTIGDWGIHWFDQILWWTHEKWPRRVFSTAARHIKQDSATAPDTQIATFEFEGFTATWEHRQYAGNESEKHPLGCYFYGTEGVFHMGWRDGWTFYPHNKKNPPIHAEPKLNDPDSQNIRELFANFLDCIKSGHRAVCDIETGHRSTVMSLLAMVSLKAGRSVVWDGLRERIVGDSAADKLLSRPYRAPWKYPKV
ncbi:MAG: Gfo/Idh/MocA family oxidoreductase [Acidobacteria bacterium]|nr:Gfo/Idh/MocA family oxidoreductase [Acidobacteriota bacterium]